MAIVRKKISELTALNSASLDTTILGVDSGITYKIELDTLADAVTSRVNILDRSRLASLENYTASFSASVVSTGTISGSSQLTASFDTRYVISGSITQTTWDNIANKPSGIVSQSTDLSSLNTFTASISTASLVNRLNAIESISGSWITESETGSFATTGSNQFNGNQTITGSLIHGNAGNIAIGEKSHVEGESTQAIGNFSHAEGLGTIAYGNYSHAEGQDTIASGSHSHAEGKETIALADHQHVQGQYNAVSSVPAAFIVGNGTDSENRSNLIHAAGNEVQITGSLIVSGSITGSTNFNTIVNKPTLISSSSQLTSSFDTRYAISASFVSSSNLSSIQTITSASYAALTPVSGTLYIIIG